jgi:hypothetical protein
VFKGHIFLKHAKKLVNLVYFRILTLVTDHVGGYMGPGKMPVRDPCSTVLTYN